VKAKLDVLIVEDNLILALDIKVTIQRLGHHVIGLATNYDQVLDIIKSQKPHLIFMDIDLGKLSKNGIKIAKSIREISSGIDIVFLTAYNDEDTMYKAYQTDPIAYIIKPFKDDDIKSTIAMCIYSKFSKEQIPDKYLQSLGHGYYFDTEKYLLFHERKPIALTQREKIFFHLLIHAGGQPVSLEKFESYFWNDSFNTQNCFRTFVYRLRNKVNKKLIGSVKNLGYTLYIN
jgi:DNA-binding response OmpR family regulator